LKRFQPEWQFHILLNDSLPDRDAALEHVDILFPIRGCGIENFHGWCFGLDIVELCTATKAFYFRHLFDCKVDHAVYLDPDIAVINSLSSVTDRLRCSDVLLTPHAFKPAQRDSEIYYSEMSSLAHGVFNLGFIAINNTERARNVVDYWCRRMENYCHDDHGRGLFTDQKWFNLVPLMFDGVEIVKDGGYNVASWNIAHRPITRRSGDLYAGSDLLRFFHFSGYDAHVPMRMFHTFGQYNSELEDLSKWYQGRVRSAEERVKRLMHGSALAAFVNGVPLTRGIRRFYRGVLKHRLVYQTPYFARKEPSFFQCASVFGLEEIERRYNSPEVIPRHF
jgi:hypothetical protein